MSQFNLKKIVPYLIALALVAVFLFFRLYKIQTSLLFFNDIGRDFLVLWQWQQTGKPPLLGPQTSALPFNQSAIYFYSLYPFYLLTGGSEYATIIAYVTFYVLAFLLGVYLLRRHPKWRNSLLIVFFLMAIQPQYIIQGRFIWNPSFVSPFILASFYLFLWLKEHFASQQKLQPLASWALAFCLSIAVSLTYSTGPTMLAFFVLALVSFKIKAIGLFLKTALALFLVNLPTVVFELRHGFLLSQMMLTREAMPQPANYLSAKLLTLNDFFFAWPPIWSLALFASLFLLVFVLVRKNKPVSSTPVILALVLFILASLITLLAPIGMQAHYIFGLLPVFFVFLALLVLESKPVLLVLTALTLFYLRPEQVHQYFAPAYRSLAASKACTQNFCATHSEPLFVSVQSDQHPYHNGMEWQFLLATSGCQLRDLVTQTDQADYMAVVIDDSQYTHGETAFNELTIFGPSQEIEEFYCQEKLSIKLLQKQSAN